MAARDTGLEALKPAALAIRRRRCAGQAPDGGFAGQQAAQKHLLARSVAAKIE